MEIQLLREPDIFPSEGILKQQLGEIYPAYESFMKTVIGTEYGLTGEWNYYKDGKSWLCKIIHKKKTVFWLSVWEGWFLKEFIIFKANI